VDKRKIAFATVMFCLIINSILFTESMWAIDWAMWRKADEYIWYYLPWAWAQPWRVGDFLNYHYYKLAICFVVQSILCLLLAWIVNKCRAHDSNNEVSNDG